MTRKDYVKVAKAINNNSYGIGKHSIGKDNLVDELCTVFEEDNPNFILVPTRKSNKINRNASTPKVFTQFILPFFFAIFTLFFMP